MYQQVTDALRRAAARGIAVRIIAGPAMYRCTVVTIDGDRVILRPIGCAYGAPTRLRIDAIDSVVSLDDLPRAPGEPRGRAA